MKTCTIIITLLLLGSCHTRDTIDTSQNPNLYSTEDLPLRLQWQRGRETAPGPLNLSIRNTLGKEILAINTENDSYLLEEGKLAGNFRWQLSDQNGVTTEERGLNFQGDSSSQLSFTQESQWPLSLGFSEKLRLDPQDLLVRYYDSDTLELLAEFPSQEIPLFQPTKGRDYRIYLESRPGSPGLVSIEITKEIQDRVNLTPVISLVEENYGLSFIQWEVLETAEAYRLTLYNQEGDIVQERTLQESSYWYNDNSTPQKLKATITALSQDDPVGLVSPPIALPDPGQIPSMRADSRIESFVNRTVTRDTPLLTARNAVFFRTPYSFTPAGMLERGTRLRFSAAEQNYFLDQDTAFFILRMIHPVKGVVYLPSDALVLDDLNRGDTTIQLLWSVDLSNRQNPRLGGVLRFLDQGSSEDFDLSSSIDRVTERVQDVAIAPLAEGRTHYQWTELFLDQVTASSPQASTRKERWVNSRLIIGEDLLDPEKIFYPRPVSTLKRYLQPAQRLDQGTLLASRTINGREHILVPLRIAEPSAILPTGRRNFSFSLVYRLPAGGPGLSNPEFLGTILEEDTFYYSDEDRFKTTAVHNLLGNDFIMSYAREVQEHRIEDPVRFTLTHPRRPFRRTFLVD
jgi:hypothetical protein